MRATTIKLEGEAALSYRELLAENPAEQADLDAWEATDLAKPPYLAD